MFERLISVFLLGVWVIGTAQGGWGHGWRHGGQENPADALSVQEADQLRYLREEEKLTRDVYDRMYQVWGLPIFDNISSAEQRHMDAVLQVISKYGLSDPAYLYSGQFNDEELQVLYDILEAQGRASQLDALLVGGLIEEVDMQDLNEMLSATNNETLINLYEKLLCGSRNHLRTFVRQIESRGTVYQAQVLDQDEVDAIVDSPMERRCGARRSGR